MTRNDFLNDVTEWWELLDFCSDEGCNICEDIIDSDQLDEYVEEDIRDTNYSWRDIRDSLSEIPTGYGYYRMNGSFDYDGMDENDFDSYKEDVLGGATTTVFGKMSLMTRTISIPTPCLMKKIPSRMSLLWRKRIFPSVS